MMRHAGHHALRRGAKPLGRPDLSDKLVVAADAARRDDNGVCRKLELTNGRAAGSLPALDLVGSRISPATPVTAPFVLISRLT